MPNISPVPDGRPVDEASHAADPAGLGRGWLTRRLPVLLQAPSQPPEPVPFELDTATTPRRFLLRVMFSAKRLTIPAMFLFILCQIGESLVPVVMGVAIDQALAAGDVTQLLIWVVALGVIFLVVAMTSRFSQQLTVFAMQLIQHRLRATLSRRVLHPAGPDPSPPDGRVVSLMTNDVSRLAAVGLAVYPIGEIAAIVFIAVSLLLIHWPLGVVVLVGAPAAVWLMGAMSGHYARSARLYQALLAKTVGRATDLVTGYRVIKGVRAEAEATARYRRASQEALDGAKRNVGRLGRYLAGSGLVSAVFVAAVAALAGWFTIDGRMSVGELIAAAGLTQALIPQMAMVTGNAVPAWAAATASSGRVLEALRTAAPGNPPHRQGSAERIDDLPPLPEIELIVTGLGRALAEPGQLVGLTTDDVTAARVAAALLSPSADDHGVHVLVEQAPAHELSETDYRSRVVVAPHTPALFSGTIAENVALSSASSEFEAVALRAAACEDFAGDGRHREVGEGGNQLSGGQRQRVALARALATNAPVLVLHDPTSAVDSVTEALIAERLRELRQGRTTLLLTSSPTLLGVCGRVIDLRRDGSDRVRASA